MILARQLRFGHDNDLQGNQTKREFQRLLVIGLIATGFCLPGPAVALEQETAQELVVCTKVSPVIRLVWESRFQSIAGSAFGISRGDC